MQPPVGREHRDRFEQIVEGRGADAQQRVARARQLHLLGLVFGDQQQPAVGRRLRHDVQVGAIAQQPILFACPRLREPVDMRLPPFGIIAHLGRPSALAPGVEQPRERPRLGDIVDVEREQAPERQIGKGQPLIGAELRHRRRQAVEQFALGVDEAAVRAAFAFQFLNIDRIARDADHPPTGRRQRDIDNAHDPPLTFDCHRDRPDPRRTRDAGFIGSLGGADPGDGFTQLDPAIDHRSRPLRLDRANIGAVDKRQVEVGIAKPHRKGRRLDQPRQRLECRHRLVAVAACLRQRVLAVGRVAQPQQYCTGAAHRLRRRRAVKDDRALAPLRLQAEDEGFGAALRTEDCLTQRIMTIGIKPAAQTAQLVEIARPLFQP